MTARTLVLGIPLPHVSFDNYSFISAPSLAEYSRLIVDMQAVSRVVLEVIDGLAAHSTFAGQPVANTSTSARSFGLADLIRMRTREAEQFFGAGGLAVCIAYADAVVEGIEGFSAWRTYGWLPQAEGFDYAEHLLPGFGRGSVEPSVVGHPFSPYIEKFRAVLTYRCWAEEPALSRSAAQVLARAAAGVPVAFDFPLASGRIALLPPFANQDVDRTEIARTLFQAFEEMAASPARGAGLDAQRT